MHQMSYYYLILRYPGLHKFINQCHILNKFDDLCQFLLALETDEDLKDV